MADNCDVGIFHGLNHAGCHGSLVLVHGVVNRSYHNVQLCQHFIWEIHVARSSNIAL